MSDPKEIAKIVSTNLNVNNGMLFEAYEEEEEYVIINSISLKPGEALGYAWDSRRYNLFDAESAQVIARALGTTAIPLSQFKQQRKAAAGR